MSTTLSSSCYNNPNELSKRQLLRCIALQQVRGMGPLRIAELLRYAGSVTELYNDTAWLDHVTGLPKHCLQELRQLILAPASSIYWQLAENTLDWLEQNQCVAIPLDSPNFPCMLRELPDCPLVLYLKGDTSLLSRTSVAVVGSRHASPQGLRIAYELSGALAAKGINVVSGMALGIDSEAHAAAIKSEGYTTAVWATGLDQIYPKMNAPLAELITEHGAIVTEMPLGTPVRRGYFPRRNRIISGLSQAVLVVEAAVNSGSLITARYAAEQGRDVFAVPGSIHNPMSRGCHRLIKDGACLVETVDDIVNELTMNGAPVLPASESASSTSASQLQVELTEQQQRILGFIDAAPTAIDSIVEHSGVSLTTVLEVLTDLELAGLIADTGGVVSRC